MLMWLGFHPDLAQADHTDPILRESSRLQVLAPRGGQTTTHGPTFLEWFEVEVHSMVIDLQGSWLIRTERYD